MPQPEKNPGFNSTHRAPDRLSNELHDALCATRDFLASKLPAVFLNTGTSLLRLSLAPPSPTDLRKALAPSSIEVRLEEAALLVKAFRTIDEMIAFHEDRSAGKPQQNWSPISAWVVAFMELASDPNIRSVGSRSPVNQHEAVDCSLGFILQNFGEELTRLADIPRPRL